MKNKNLKDILINVNDLSFKYHKKFPYVIKNLTFSLKKGESLVILGSNGSGKSTLGKIISGLLLHFEGKISLFGKNLSENNYQKLITKIGFVFQNSESQFIGENVLYDLAFNLENKNESKKVMRQKIVDIVKRFSLQRILHYNPTFLSGGEKQKVSISSILIDDPEIIIFDESTSMLDQNTKKEIWKMIDLLKDDQITTIEITHDLERVLQSSKVLVLEKGMNLFYGSREKFLQIFPEICSQSNLKIPFILKLFYRLYEKKIIQDFNFDISNLKKYLKEKKNEF